MSSHVINVRYEAYHQKLSSHAINVRYEKMLCHVRVYSTSIWNWHDINVRYKAYQLILTIYVKKTYGQNHASVMSSDISKILLSWGKSCHKKVQSGKCYLKLSKHICRHEFSDVKIKKTQNQRFSCITKHTDNSLLSEVKSCHKHTNRNMSYEVMS